MSVCVDPFRDQIAFRSERCNPVVLAESERTRVILACFEPGQFIPVHRPGVDLTLVVLEGRGRLVAGEKEHELRAGAIAFVPAGEEGGGLAGAALAVRHVETARPRRGVPAEP